MTIRRSMKEVSSNIQGQISVMIGVMIATFIFFFAFVINTGMLVNAKINLQNAADLAAFAGASVQARQLNNISFLNYEMRRQWKKFLFRIYVLGNAGYDSFPPRGPTQGAMTFIPNSTNPQNFDVPVTCTYWTVNSCRLTRLVSISIPPSQFMDPITDTLRDALRHIEQIREDNCRQMGLTNQLLNSLWLYNTTPDLNMTAVNPVDGFPPEVQASINLITQLASGLGIVPKEVLLKMRIQTLAAYVNTPGRTINAASIAGLSNGTAGAQNERSISAFYSAFYTLGNFTFNSDSIELAELLPSKILDLKPIDLPHIDTYALDLKTNVNAGGTSNMDPNGSSKNDCIPTVFNIQTPTKLTVGFYKEPTTLTYYAVRLKAQAQLLFNPFGPTTLEAYSAAQPFGSRIGPKLDASAFTYSSDGPSQLSTNSAKYAPGLAVREEETSSKGWSTADLIWALAQAGGMTNNNDRIVNLREAYLLAMAPNPWEVKNYNILTSLGRDSFLTPFPAQAPYSVWAPLSLNGTPNLEDITDAFSAGITSNDVGEHTDTPSQNFTASHTSAITAQLAAGLQTYIAQLQAGRGETQEGFFEGTNVVNLADPVSPLAQRYPNLFVTDPNAIRTSWNHPAYETESGSGEKEGRIGYSVKYISFDSINRTQSTPETNGISNGLEQISDSSFGSIWPFIKH